MTPNAWAIADGSHSWRIPAFLSQTHGLPFQGVLIRWWGEWRCV